MIENELNNLFKLAKFAGGRFDLVQASGGNVSVKLSDESVLIKVSGISMSEMESVEHCAKLDKKKVLAILNNAQIKRADTKVNRELLAQTLLKEANLTPEKRPSIEAFFHVMLYKYTLHVHPITVNHLVINHNANLLTAELFPDSLFIDYETPGIDLSLMLQSELEKYQSNYERQPQLVFLKNHGLIVSADNYDQAISLTEFVVETIEEFLQINYQRYRQTSVIANLYNKYTEKDFVAYLCEDQQILQLWQMRPHLIEISPTSPDQFVFNGYGPCEIVDLSGKELDQYHHKYSVLPKVIIYQQNIYFMHRNVRKAKEMEEVFKFHLMALSEANGTIECLSLEELCYLANWEAEKYRQNR